MLSKKLKIFIKKHQLLYQISLKIKKNLIKAKVILLIIDKYYTKFLQAKTAGKLSKFNEKYGKLNINLGCCEKKDYGWINVDLDKKVKPDIVDNVITLKKFKDNTVNYIKSTHLIEHLVEEDALQAIRRWFKVLKPGGTLSIECPSLSRSIKLIYSDDPVAKKFGYVGIFGYPPHIKKSSFYHCHKHGWSVETLTEALKQNGFSDIKEVQVEQTWRCDNQKYKRDMRVVAKKLI